MGSVLPQDGRNGARGQAGPPVANSTKSYWHRESSKRLLGHRTTSELPATAEVVIIGSGITGTFAARELVAGGKSVVMLEAREACWGATGRNGGHCQPGVWDAPAEVARFELATFHLIKELVTKHEIPCDFQVVGGMHPIFSSEVLEAAKTQIERLQKYPDLQDKAVLIQDRDELTRRHVPNAIAAIYQPNAGKCWPYKLVTWLLEQLLDENDAAVFNIQTNTLVERLQKSGSSWSVHTPRGEIKAQHVLLASNAYTSYLVPEMTGLITPVRGQVCALTPPPGAVQLPHSYVWMKGADHQYLIQRGPEDTQVDDGGKIPYLQDKSIVFGGERLAEPNGEEGVSRDDEISPSISKALHKCVNDVLELVPPSQGDDRHIAGVEPLEAAYEWTGIMGYSSDGGPWVGRVPEVLLRDLGASADSVENAAGGLWMAAGFTGHGMPVAARCGAAAAEMILGKEDGIQVPRSWIVSEERAKRTKGLAIPRTLGELLSELPSK